MLFKVLKRSIENENYISKEDMEEKLSILFANNQITKEQYQELINLLKK